MEDEEGAVRGGRVSSSVQLHRGKSCSSGESIECSVSPAS